MKGKTTMRGWLLISPEGIVNKKDFDYWLGIVLDFNKTTNTLSKAKKNKSIS